ncbi:MAG: lipid-binding SYLF domain-containing protein [Bacteroidetes bacterium]|nr:lipid-binding SYLF domain-containing protein [Bacteroidota bacterium]
MLGILLSGIAISQSTAYDQEEVEEASLAKQAILEKDPGLEQFFNEAYGYAILPTVGKGGFIVGGAAGKGVLYQGGEPVGLVKMKQMTVGAQIGGKSYIEVIFFNTESEYTVFKSGRFEVSAQVAAIAVTAGVSQTMAYSDGIAILTMGRGGFMAEASVGGQKFSFQPFEEYEER